MTHNIHDRIPSEEECMELTVRHGMLENIRDHSILVMKVSRAIAQHCTPETHISIPLVVAGALLHDITKTRALVTHEHHDRTGAELCRSIGFFAVADIINAHVDFPDFDPLGPLLEKEIVHYSDKRVKHSTIVSLKERVADLVDRYGSSDAHKKLIMEKIPFNTALEEKIRRHLTKDLEEILCGIK